MVKLLSFLLPLLLSISMGFGIPLQMSGSLLKEMNFTVVSNQSLPVSQHLNEDLKSSLKVDSLNSNHLDHNIEGSLDVKPLHSSHLDQSLEVNPLHTSTSVETSKSSVFKDSVIIPFKTGVESAAIGGQVTAAGAIKGTVKGSAIATPIILKAVALPGIAAGATAGLMSFPDWLAQNAKSNSHFIFQNAKTSVTDSVQDFAHLFILDDSKLDFTQQDLINESQEPIVDLNKGVQQVAKTIGAVKAGAVGLAAKGLLAAKNGVRVAGRLIFKPIAIVTGVHLKMLGSGLALGGKLIGGTGAGIAKAGTAVKFAGLGSIGLGASAISWGLDKTTIDTHFQESRQKFIKLN